MEKQAKTIKIITAIIVAVMFICTIVLTCQLIKINNLKEKNNNLQTQKEQLIKDIYNYNSTNSYYNNNRSEYLESYAREMLTWGEENETWYTKG